MKRYLVPLLGLMVSLGFCHRVYAQALTTGDVCSNYAKRSAGVTISTAADTQLVAPIANASITLCNCSITQAGGTGTVYFESATGATCTGTLTQQSGTVTAGTVAANLVLPEADTTFLQLPSGQGLCVKSTGTIAQGVTCSYVQK